MDILPRTSHHGKQWKLGLPTLIKKVENSENAPFNTSGAIMHQMRGISKHCNVPKWQIIGDRTQ